MRSSASQTRDDRDRQRAREGKRAHLIEGKRDRKHQEHSRQNPQPSPSRPCRAAKSAITKRDDQRSERADCADRLARAIDPDRLRLRHGVEEGRLHLRREHAVGAREAIRTDRQESGKACRSDRGERRASRIGRLATSFGTSARTREADTADRRRARHRPRRANRRPSTRPASRSGDRARAGGDRHGRAEGGDGAAVLAAPGPAERDERRQHRDIGKHLQPDRQRCSRGNARRACRRAGSARMRSASATIASVTAICAL